jgi:hypothetical protein
MVYYLSEGMEREYEVFKDYLDKVWTKIATAEAKKG